MEGSLTGLRCMPLQFTAMQVTSSCSPQQTLQPRITPDAAKGGTRVRPTRLWSYAHVRVTLIAGVEHGGGVRRDVTANPQPKKVGCLLVLSLHTGTCTGLSLAPASVCSPVRLSMASPTPVCRCGDGTTGGWGELGGYGWRRPYTFEDRRRQGTRGAGAGAETVRATQCHPTDAACQ
jgi:hypothetical protein